MQPLLERLQGGDRRSIGRSAEAVAAVREEPSLLGVLVVGFTRPDPVVAMRAADALEKASATRTGCLRPYAEDLPRVAAATRIQEVRWHPAQMLPRLELSSAERGRAVELLTGFLDDRSGIVRTCAMQALADLSIDHPGLLADVAPKLSKLAERGTPAMRARGRKLLRRLRTVYVER